MYRPVTELLHGHRLNKGNNKAQASIEFSLAFVIAILFLVLTARVFVWFGGTLLRRQIAYENTRVVAGTPGSEAGKADFYSKPKLDLFGNKIFK